MEAQLVDLLVAVLADYLNHLESCGEEYVGSFEKARSIGKDNLREYVQSLAALTGEEEHVLWERIDALLG